ncbi:MAG: S1 family peptidase [Myxococcales bacterium]|nr:S1 family peptidase [Myxococcales bacterium]
MTKRANSKVGWMKAALAFVGAAGLALSTVACAGETVAPADVEIVQTSEAKIYGGERDEAATLTGVVALKVGTGQTFELCTGALVAPNLVLTARHCVSKALSPTVVCDENGRSGNGDHVAADVDAETIAIYTGADPQFARAPRARGKAVVHGGGNVLCDADIALVVLDEALDDVPVLPVRVGQPIRAGETIKTIGYGRNDQKLPTGTRMLKDGVGVLAIGKGVSASKTPLGKHEFETGKATCQGDSGGPAISEKTGAVIGVVSRGGECNDDFGHIYTSTVDQQALFAKAFAAVGAAPALETGSTLEPKKSATPAASEPAPPAGGQGGCSQSGGASHGGSFAVVVAGVLGLALLRNRRSAKR